MCGEHAHTLSGHKEGHTGRKQPLTSGLGALALVLCLAAGPPAQADNPNCVTTTSTFEFGTDTPFAFQNPCNGEFIDGTATRTDTFCVRYDGSGGQHTRGAFEITGTGVGEQGNIYTIKCHFVDSDVTDNLNAQGDGEIRGLDHMNIISQGAAPNFVQTCQFHAIVRNFQIVAVQRGQCTATCSGQGNIPPP